MARGDSCGPDWLPSKVRELLFGWFFEASCSKHDEGYTVGGNERRRYVCDLKFWQAMKKDTLRFDGVERLMRWSQALSFYTSVRLFGWLFFNYTNRP
jgi:hypothetical protein